ncbi:MAG TPA: Zn-dependent hydrolase [Gemmatimonadaceae bacterium]|nr:Zn-dependent hydrolase [Gemmatimonadaceae bacterium]
MGQADQAAAAAQERGRQQLSPIPPTVNAERLHGRLAALSHCGRTAAGGVTRLAYSDADREARALVMDWMREAGLAPSVDFAGNIIGRRAGADASRGPLLFGSHVDSVPDGGNYDGPLGTLAAIETAAVIAEQGRALRHPIEVVVWSNEEGGLFGSRAVSGQLPVRELQNVSRSGKTVADGIASIGGDPARLDEIQREPGAIAGYLELHIEQGAILEQSHTDIGVVEGIVGLREWNVTITGAANHGGTTPMDERRDALLSAARFIEMVNRVVRSVPGHQVGTVGRIEATPGAVNAIAGLVVCSLELRDLDTAKIDSLFARIRGEARRIGESDGTTFAFADLMTGAPAPSDPRMREAIAQSADALGLSWRAMPSGAGHDAQAMATLGPMGMIFVPSVGGISHSPREYSTPEAVVNGANVLLGALLAADRELP